MEPDLFGIRRRQRGPARHPPRPRRDHRQGVGMVSGFGERQDLVRRRLRRRFPGDSHGPARRPSLRLGHLRRHGRRDLAARHRRRRPARRLRDERHGVRQRCLRRRLLHRRHDPLSHGQNDRPRRQARLPLHRHRLRLLRPQDPRLPGPQEDRRALPRPQQNHPRLPPRRNRRPKGPRRRRLRRRRLPPHRPQLLLLPHPPSPAPGPLTRPCCCDDDDDDDEHLSLSLSRGRPRRSSAEPSSCSPPCAPDLHMMLYHPPSLTSRPTRHPRRRPSVPMLSLPCVSDPRDVRVPAAHFLLPSPPATWW
mmetsp:Transcript_8011/g.20794  ORF Transcript_8011/g.20794 Transcript_8011/m.20794 type:complete len:306 (+) Transcript_8011:175-1092(+)